MARDCSRRMLIASVGMPEVAEAKGGLEFLPQEPLPSRSRGTSRSPRARPPGRYQCLMDAGGDARHGDFGLLTNGPQCSPRPEVVRPHERLDGALQRATGVEHRSASSPGYRAGFVNAEQAKTLIAVVDDDESVRESIPDLLHEFGYTAQGFPSAEVFLAKGDFGRTQCLILDVALPGMSGPDLQRELRRRGSTIPVVFMTGYGDESTRPKLLEQGVTECLFKPFSETALMRALESALRVK